MLEKEKNLEEREIIINKRIEKEKSKRYKRKILTISIIIILFLFPLIYLLIQSNPEIIGIIYQKSVLSNKNTIHKIPTNNPTNKQINPLMEKNSSSKENPSETINTNGNKNNQNQNCEKIPLSYSLRNFNSNQTCNLISGNICINQTVNCDVNLENIDATFSGVFTVNFKFVDESKKIFAEKEITNQVPANSIIKFVSSKNFKGINANKKINCDFTIRKVATKEIC